jgi:hypothetical protein
MRIVLFLCRVALLCNILFFLCVTITRTKDFIHHEDVNNYIIILGWFVAPLLNFMLNILLMLNFFRKKENAIPSWLSITNFLMLLLQMMILFH